MKISKRIFIGVFCLLVLAPFIFSSIVGYYFVFGKNITQPIRLDNNITEATTHRLNPLYEELNNVLMNESKNIKFLSKLSSIKEFVLNNTSKSDIEKDIKSFLGDDKVGYRLQYIDNKGNSLIDIESLGKNHFKEMPVFSIENNDFLNKISQLNNGEMYISNVELYSDEKSSNTYSFVKIGIPIFNNTSIKRGTLVLSIPTNYLFGDIEKYSRNDESVFLINQNGDYLAHQDKTKEIYFSHSVSSNLFSEHKGLNKNFYIDSDKGSFEYQDKLFVYKIIYPTMSNSEIYKGSEKIFGENSEKTLYWVLVSEISKSSLVGTSTRPQVTYIKFIAIVGGSAALLLMFVFLVVLRISGNFFKNNLNKK